MTVRELVTCEETISENSEAMPPLIILPGKQFIKAWFHEGLDNDYLMAVSDTGYSNDKIHFDWIQHFNTYTARRQKRVWRFLLDGYGSHITYEFLEYCHRNKIIVFALLPHSTHLCQPLDVVVFQLYKHWHKKAVNEATRTGYRNFNKIEFLAAIRSIRAQTFKRTTILSA